MIAEELSRSLVAMSLGRKLGTEISAFGHAVVGGVDTPRTAARRKKANIFNDDTRRLRKFDLVQKEAMLMLNRFGDPACDGRV